MEEANTQTNPQAMANQLDAQRNLDRQNQRQAGDKTKEEKSGDPNYPNPIGFGTFLIFGLIATMQDLTQILFDVLGVGFIAGWILLPITWFCYYFLIIRRAPKPMSQPMFFGTLWKRAYLLTFIEVIPIIGELGPLWIATAIMVYVMIRRYQKDPEKFTQELASKPSATAKTPRR